MKSAKTILNTVRKLETLVVLYLVTLLFFGRAFTKFQIIGPLYLHDAVLILLTLLALNRGRIVFRFRSIFWLVVLAFLYLIVSLLVYHLPAAILTMAFRQFNLFVYIACSYILFNVIVKDPGDLDKPLYLIKLISVLSVWLQLLLLCYGFLFVPHFSLFGESDYNYYSPLAVFGIITYSALVLAYEKGIWWKWIKFFAILGLSTTLGHSSAFLAVFVIFMIYFFIRITPLQRFMALAICAGAILLLKMLPEFQDINASWRLYYWDHVMHRLIHEKIMLFGFGFGQPFMTYEYAVYLNDTLHTRAMMDDFFPMVRYLVPPHNSVLSILFHVGIIPGAILLFLPLMPMLRQIVLRSISDDPRVNFLIYAVAGCFIWILFNVILELPHSATYFWLVFFTAAYGLKTHLAQVGKKSGPLHIA